jgi:phosphatidylglycerol---prolipoprotein diacylglyceryl transferase
VPSCTPWAPTDRAWGFIYTHELSPSFQAYGAIATHPAVVYEMFLDLAVVALALWVFPKILRPDGMVFAASLALYAFGRFFILFFHNYNIWFFGLNEAQVISVLVLGITIPLLALKAKIVPPSAPETVTMKKPSRAVRRRALHS